MQDTQRATVYKIPVCPFCQRLEILLALKGRSDAVSFQTIDITRPRPSWLLEKTGGTTALPVLEQPGGEVIKESLVIMKVLDDQWPEVPIAQRDPARRAIEESLTQLASAFTTAGYVLLMNQDASRRDELHEALLSQYARLNDFLVEHATHPRYLFEQFGWCEAVFTPLFMRFWFLEYYENFELPLEPRYQRVRQWVEACVSHPAAQQVSREEIVKLYYDYSQGVGNGGLPTGRTQSSFAFEPAWQVRPWPPCDKYTHHASDQELGLV